jgi:phenylpropionate dioxygenase-like ring-hydroxylating dioxygenase large terminal subunit
MLNAEQNKRVTRTGKATPCGALMRCYWQPVALVEELAGDRPLKALTLMGEELVLFRRECGGYGLIGRRCPHRGADLCFGRLEDGGLRCVFHGWLFDAEGRCLEQPAEPPGSTFYRKVRATAYPCVARNGIVFAYLGEGAPPPMPAFDCFAAPDRFTFAFKGLIECNWLQALEVGIDPAHASFLHRFLVDEDPDEGYGQQFRDRAANTQIPQTRVLREHFCPQIDVEAATHGLRIFARRDVAPGETNIRVTNQMFPNAIVIPMSNDMIITQWHVPIDDQSCWWYAIFTAFRDPVDKERMRRQRLELYTLPDYRARRNKSNDYGFDAEEQRNSTYTGMGMDINVHDQWAVESLGVIQDRSQEHLGASDKAITAYRRMLLKALEDNAPPFLPDAGQAAAMHGPPAIDAIGPSDEWRDVWRNADRARRAASSWAAKP